MRPRIQRKSFSLKIMLAIACVCVTAETTWAKSSRVMVRNNMPLTHVDQLVKSLRVITGLTELRFDHEGMLRLEGDRFARGSEKARELLAQAVEGANVIILEDASSRADVAFCRVVPGRWTDREANKPPAFVILIDFKDFEQISGDAEARAAFDVGWGVLHELDHVVTNSDDAKHPKVIGECEDHINAMRLELGLPIRADYFFSAVNFKTDANFNARYVRLSFERRDAATTKRYWLVWDANAVGGLA